MPRAPGCIRRLWPCSIKDRPNGRPPAVLRPPATSRTSRCRAGHDFKSWLASLLPADSVACDPERSAKERSERRRVEGPAFGQRYPWLCQGTLPAHSERSLSHVGARNERPPRHQPVLRYRPFDFLAAALLRAAFSFFCFAVDCSVDLARAVLGLGESPSASSYASRSQSVRGASTSSRCLI